MNCPKCSGSMTLLLFSSICDTCDPPTAPQPKCQEDYENQIYWIVGYFEADNVYRTSSVFTRESLLWFRRDDNPYGLDHRFARPVRLLRTLDMSELGILFSTDDEGNATGRVTLRVELGEADGDEKPEAHTVGPWCDIDGPLSP